VSEPSTRSQAKRELQERQRVWLQEVIKATGKKPSQIAGVAGVSDTTLTRLLNKADYVGTLSQLTIDRIKEAFKVPGPEEYATTRRGALIGLAEAERFDFRHEPKNLARLVETMVGDRQAADPWRLKTSALEMVGYLAGDLVIVDLNAHPSPQDVVCAQVYDWQRGAAETVFRVFDPPFLVGASNDRTAYKPLLVDNERVVIKGVVVESFRPHRLSATR
jgi:hypothetical protein